MNALRTALKQLIRWAPAVLISAAIGGAAGYYLDSQNEPEYQAAARFVISPGEAFLTGENRDLVNSLNALDTPTLGATFAEVIASEIITLAAAESSGITNPEDYDVQATLIPGASVVVVRVTGPDAQLVAPMAQATGEEAATFMQDLFAAYEMRIVDFPENPTSPSSPRPVQTAVVAAAVTTIVAMSLVLLINPTVTRTLASRWEDDDDQPSTGNGRRPPVKAPGSNGHRTTSPGGQQPGEVRRTVR